MHYKVYALRAIYSRRLPEGHHVFFMIHVLLCIDRLNFVDATWP